MINLLFFIETTINDRVLGLPRRWLAHMVPAGLRPLLILGVLSVSVALSYLASPGQLRLLLLLVPAVGAMAAFAQWPPLGLVALIAAILVVPSPSLRGGFNLAVLFLAALVGLWLVDMIAGRREIRLVPSRTVPPLLALVLAAVLAFGVGQLRWFSFARSAPLDAQLGALAIFVLAAGAFLLVAHQVHDPRWLQALTWLFLALGALFVAGWLVPAIGQFTSRLFQLGATANALFWVWLVALAFSQALFNRKLHPAWRLALGGLVVATLYVAFFKNYDWKAGWLPPLLTLVAIIGCRSWQAGLALVAMGVVPAMSLVSQAIASDTYSYLTRMEAWRIVLEISKVNPILGLGPANYYWYTPLYPILGWSVQFNSHSQYIDIVAQTGLLGLACFLWFVWELGRLGWRLRSQVPAGFERAYVYGALGGLAGTLAACVLVDWLLPFVYNIGLKGFPGSILAWLFLGGLVSLEQMTLRQAAARTSEAA